MTTITQLDKYPEIEINLTQLDLDKVNIARQIEQYFNEFGFFYLNDFFDIRSHLDDTLLNTLPGAVDVFYGEEAYTYESFKFHGTYARFQPSEDHRLDNYFQIFSMLRSLISLSLGKAETFLDSISEERDYALYIYQHEAEYLKLLSGLEETEISVPPHVDKSLITIVVSIKGLEGYFPQQQAWVSVPDREGYLIVHGGTLLQQLTQGKIQAEIHRVRASDSSKAIFWGFLPAVKPN